MAALRASKRRGGVLFFMAPLLGLPVEDAAPCHLENTTDALLLERIVGRKALPAEHAVTS